MPSGICSKTASVSLDDLPLWAPSWYELYESSSGSLAVPGRNCWCWAVCLPAAGSCARAPANTALLLAKMEHNHVSLATTSWKRGHGPCLRLDHLGIFSRSLSTSMPEAQELANALKAKTWGCMLQHSVAKAVLEFPTKLSSFVDACT